MGTRIQEMLDGGFKVCFNQGLNVRMITAESAVQVARLQYYDDSFTKKRIYTAWDNFKDEPIFMRGIQLLLSAGIRADEIEVYMLIGYDKTETWDRIFDRLNKMVALGLRPFPMVFNNERKDLKLFQKWVVRRYYEIIPWAEFVAFKGNIPGLHEAAKGLDAEGPDISHRRGLREKSLAARESAQPELFGSG